MPSDSYEGGEGVLIEGSLAQEFPVQRLFGTFPHGWPGAGLVLLRVVAAIPLVQQGVAGAQAAPPHALVILELVAAGAAVLLLLGLWTPIAGAVVAVAELSLLLSHPQEPWPSIQLAMLGAALAMLGPGRWSVDARLFGRKHIPIPQP